MSKASYIKQEEFEQIIESNKIVVVDYTAPWCGPCKVVAPMIDRLAEEYVDQAAVVKIDIDQNPDNPKKYGIRSIPAVLIFKQGQVVETIVGKTSYEVFSNKLEEQLRA